MNKEESTILKTFAKNVKGYRKSKRLTQQEFADQLGIKRSSLGSYEEGRVFPHVPTICRMSRHMKTPIDKLLLSHVIWCSLD